MKIKLVDGLPYHPTRRHPHTGKRLRAVYIRSNGQPVWPVIGASEDDGGNEGGEDADDADADEDNTNGDDKDDKGTEKPKKSKEPEESDEQREIKALRKRLAAADRNKEAALKRVRDLENKDKPKEEVEKQELEEAKQQAAKAAQAMQNLAKQNAFLTASQKAKINWHDVDVAQKAADLSDVEINEDGNVTGMAEAVKALAKAKPFLVDKGEAAKDDKEEKKNGPSGSGVGSRNNGGKGTGKPDNDKLRAMFPALNK